MGYYRNYRLPYYYRRYRPYRKYRRDDPGVEFFGGLILLIGWGIYYLIRGTVFSVRWLWNALSGRKSRLLNQYQLPIEHDESSPSTAVNIHIETKPRTDSWYFRKPSLLTPAENNFYKVLEKIATENNYIIQTKVRLEALIGVHFFAENWWGLRNRIKSREMDFVICNKILNPMLVIELDDSSHQREDRIERDKNLDRILNDAGLPILHIPAAYSYDPNILLKEISEKIVK